MTTNTTSGAAELLKALTAATRSLETIQLFAGKEDTLEDMMQVRAYATSRAMVANAAIAAFEDASAQSADECQHGSKHIVHDCMRCGAPVCCGKCCAEDTQPQHEDLAIWKKRALEAEALNHRFITDINGPTFVGEPSTSDDALMAREFYESQEDSLLLCASDLQHSAIYDNSAEMQACMRAVADRIAALASAPAQPAAQQGVAYAALPDPADIIAGALQISRGHAYELMREAVATDASHGQAPAATTFCWATELAMVREPVTLTVKEARGVSDQMQRLHAASFKTELRNITSIDMDGDQAVRLAFMSCRAASAFKRAVEAAWPTI